MCSMNIPEVRQRLTLYALFKIRSRDLDLSTAIHPKVASPHYCNTNRAKACCRTSVQYSVLQYSMPMPPTESRVMVSVPVLTLECLQALWSPCPRNVLLHGIRPVRAKTNVNAERDWAPRTSQPAPILHYMIRAAVEDKQAWWRVRTLLSSSLSSLCFETLRGQLPHVADSSGCICLRREDGILNSK